MIFIRIFCFTRPIHKAVYTDKNTGREVKSKTIIKHVPLKFYIDEYFNQDNEKLLDPALSVVFHREHEQRLNTLVHDLEREIT